MATDAAELSIIEHTVHHSLIHALKNDAELVRFEKEGSLELETIPVNRILGQVPSIALEQEG